MDCENCGKELQTKITKDPKIDWIKIVCEKCGEISDKSIVREIQKK